MKIALNEEFDDFSNEFSFCIFTDKISRWNRPLSVASILKSYSYRLLWFPDLSLMNSEQKSRHCNLSGNYSISFKRGKIIKSGSE